MYNENLLSKKMRTFAEKNDWLISGEYIYGSEQGYLFSGMEGKGQKTFITPVPGIEEAQVTELFDRLGKNSATMKLQEFDIADDFLCIRIKDSVSLKPEDIEFIIALLVGIMQELTIVTEGRCQVCGNLGADSEDFVYDLYCYMHRDCAAQLKDELASDETVSGDGAEDAAEGGIAGAGAAGAAEAPDTVPLWKKILFTSGGAVFGAIPWLIMPYVLDYLLGFLTKVNAPSFLSNVAQSLLTCLCAYFVSYFAIIGYRLSRARMDIRGRWIAGIVSVAVVILVQFAYLAVLIIKEPSVALTFKNYMTNLVKYNFYFNMILGAGIGIVFTLIAVLPFFDSSIKSDSAKKDFLKHRKLSDDEDILDEDIRDEETIREEAQAESGAETGAAAEEGREADAASGSGAESPADAPAEGPDASGRNK